MGYWTGSGVDTIEFETTIYCPRCDDEIEDVTVYADGARGNATCPVCDTEVEVEV